MSLDISAYRSGQGDRLALNNVNPQQATDVIKAELPFGDRVVNYFKSGNDKYGTVQQQQENRDFKTTFRDALRKAEGPDVAARAARAAGLPPNWWTNAKPMSEKQVKLVLDYAQHFRMSAVRQTERQERTFLASPQGFAQSFTNAVRTLPDSDVNNPQLIALFKREVRTDDNYAKRTLTPQDMHNATLRAIDKFQTQKRDGFGEQHAGLSGFAQSLHGNGLPQDSRHFFSALTEKLVPSMANGHPLAGDPANFRYVAQSILNEVSSTKDVLGKMSYDPTGWQSLRQELDDKDTQLDALDQRLTNLHMNDMPQSAEGIALVQALHTEITHQRNLLQAKTGFLDDLRNNDPLSKKTVAYSNLMWAHAAGKIFDEAIQHLTNTSPHGALDPGVVQMQQAKLSLINLQNINYVNAPTDQRTNLPGTIAKSQHPATLGKTATEAYLRNFMTQAGIPRATIDELTTSKKLGSARQQALNESGTWLPITRNMVVTKDGVTRTYQSKITPGGSISPRFARRYADPNLGGNGPQHTPRVGISSATKADHYHARNLKVSELERVVTNQPNEKMMKVIGHGVLDMWDIENPGERRTANERGAKEVLEAAIVTNDRIRTEALNRAQNGGGPIKITHVSVNLVTPAGWRELPGLRGTDKLHDYQEQTYTQEQFRAFDTHSGVTQFQIDDDRLPGGLVVNQGLDTNIQVDVNVISFSFGINPIATDRVPDFVGGWASVYEHNQGMMVKFVGDLGTGPTGSVGTRPGGFIGSVMDRLNPNVPAEKELLVKLQEQSDITRGLFASEDFKRGNGDPAKMGRHILALQSLAEEALDLLGVADEGATMSKGCKSDKDRGGVTDVELKHQMITEDMGGQITPDGRLKGDDQENYYVIASSSGQLENQVYNTGIPGSKEAGKLEQRIPSSSVRQYLSGLGAFASE